MQKRHQDARPEMQWLVADMTDTSAVFPAGECFEVAIDKGTLDAMLCTDDGSSLYCEVLASPCSVSRVACGHTGIDGTGRHLLAASRSECGWVSVPGFAAARPRPGLWGRDTYIARTLRGANAAMKYHVSFSGWIVRSEPVRWGMLRCGMGCERRWQGCSL